MGKDLEIEQSGTYTVSNKMDVEIEGDSPVTATLVGDGSNIRKLEIDFDKAVQADTVILDLSTFGAGPLEIELDDYNAVDSIQIAGGTLTGVDPNDPELMNFTYTDANGNVQTGTFKLKGDVQNWNANPLVICFASGTMIDTPGGPIPVETLQTGDEVRCWDGTCAPVRWIGTRRLSWWDLQINPKLRPVRIFAGSLGQDIPNTDLVVSRQHRVMIEGPMIELWFTTPQVLVPAISLVDAGLAEIDMTANTVTYHHILLDTHEVLRANDAPAESLMLGDGAMDAIGAAQMQEIKYLFPEIFEDERGASTACRMVLAGKDSRIATCQLTA